MTTSAAAGNAVTSDPPSATWRKMVGVALVWVGLSALAHVSGATPLTPVVWVSLLGFATIVAQLKRELGR